MEESIAFNLKDAKDKFEGNKKVIEEKIETLVDEVYTAGKDILRDFTAKNKMDWDGYEINNSDGTYPVYNALTVNLPAKNHQSKIVIVNNEPSENKPSEYDIRITTTENESESFRPNTYLTRVLSEMRAVDAGAVKTPMKKAVPMLKEAKDLLQNKRDELYQDAQTGMDTIMGEYMGQ